MLACAFAVLCDFGAWARCLHVQEGFSEAFFGPLGRVLGPRGMRIVLDVAVRRQLLQSLVS